MAADTQNVMENENATNATPPENTGRVDFVVNTISESKDSFDIHKSIFTTEDGSKGFELTLQENRIPHPDAMNGEMVGRDIHVHFFGENAPEDIDYKDVPEFVPIEHIDPAYVPEDLPEEVKGIVRHTTDSEYSFVPTKASDSPISINVDVLSPDTPMGKYLDIDLPKDYTYKVNDCVLDANGRMSRVDSTVIQVDRTKEDAAPKVLEKTVSFNEFREDGRVVKTEKTTKMNDDGTAGKVEYKISGLTKEELVVRHDRVAVCEKIKGDLESRARVDDAPHRQDTVKNIIENKIPAVMADFVSSLDKLEDLHAVVKSSDTKDPGSLSLPQLRDAYIAVSIVDNLAIVPERYFDTTAVDKQNNLRLGQSYEIFKSYFGTEAGQAKAQQIEKASGIDYLDKRLKQHYTEFSHGIDNSGDNFIEITPLLVKDLGPQNPTDFIKESFVVNNESVQDKKEKYEQLVESSRNIPGVADQVKDVEKGDGNKDNVSNDSPFTHVETEITSDSRIDLSQFEDSTVKVILESDFPLETIASTETQDYIFKAEGESGLLAYNADVKDFANVLSGIDVQHPHTPETKEKIEELKNISARIVDRLDACEKKLGYPLDIKAKMTDIEKLKTEINERGAKLFTDRNGRMIPGHIAPTDLFSLRAELSYFSLATRTSNEDWKAATGVDKPSFAPLKVGITSLMLIGQIINPAATMTAYARALYGAFVDKAQTLESAGRKDVEIKIGDNVDVRDATKGAAIVVTEIIDNPDGKIATDLRNYISDDEYNSLRENIQKYIDTKDPAALQKITDISEKVSRLEADREKDLDKFEKFIKRLAYDETHDKDIEIDNRPSRHFDSRDTFQAAQLLSATWKAFKLDQTVDFKLPGTDLQRDKHVGIGSVLIATYNFVKSDLGYTLLKYVYKGIKDSWGEYRLGHAVENVQKIEAIANNIDLSNITIKSDNDPIDNGSAPVSKYISKSIDKSGNVHYLVEVRYGADGKKSFEKEIRIDTDGTRHNIDRTYHQTADGKIVKGIENEIRIDTDSTKHNIERTYKQTDDGKTVKDVEKEKYTDKKGTTYEIERTYKQTDGGKTVKDVEKEIRVDTDGTKHDIERTYKQTDDGKTVKDVEKERYTDKKGTTYEIERTYKQTADGKAVKDVEKEIRVDTDGTKQDIERTYKQTADGKAVKDVEKETREDTKGTKTEIERTYGQTADGKSVKDTEKEKSTDKDGHISSIERRFTYDDQGRYDTGKEIRVDKDGTKHEIDRTYKPSPDEKTSLKDVEKEKITDVKGKVNNFERRYTYDEQGRYDTCKDSRAYANGTQVYIERTYKPTADGKKSVPDVDKETRTYADGSRRDIERTYKQTADGKAVTDVEKEIRTDKYGITHDIERSYKQNADGKTVKDVETEKYTDYKGREKSIERRFDENGNLKGDKEARVDTDGTKHDIERTYKQNADGKTVKDVETDKYTDAKGRERSIERHYENNNLKSDKEVRVDTDGTTHDIERTYHVNENGDSIREKQTDKYTDKDGQSHFVIKEYDAEGKPVSRTDNGMDVNDVDMPEDNDESSVDNIEDTDQYLSDMDYYTDEELSLDETEIEEDPGFEQDQQDTDFAVNTDDDGQEPDEGMIDIEEEDGKEPDPEDMEKTDDNDVEPEKQDAEKPENNGDLNPEVEKQEENKEERNPDDTDKQEPDNKEKNSEDADKPENDGAENKPEDIEKDDPEDTEKSESDGNEQIPDGEESKDVATDNKNIDAATLPETGRPESANVETGETNTKPEEDPMSIDESDLTIDDGVEGEQSDVENNTTVGTEQNAGDIAVQGKDGSDAAASDAAKEENPVAVVKEDLAPGEALPEDFAEGTISEQVAALVDSGAPEAAVEVCRNAKSEGQDLNAEDYVYALQGAIQFAEAKGATEEVVAYKEELAEVYHDDHNFVEAANIYESLDNSDMIVQMMTDARDSGDFESAAHIAEYNLGNAEDLVEMFKVEAALPSFVDGGSTSTFDEIYQKINNDHPDYTPQDFNEDVAAFIQNHHEDLTPDQAHDLFDCMLDLETHAGGADIETYSAGDLYDQYFDGSDLDRTFLYDTASASVGDNGSQVTEQVNNFEEVTPIETGTVTVPVETVSAPMSTDDEHIDLDAMTLDALRDFVNNSVLNGENYDPQEISQETKDALTDKVDLEGLKVDLEENGHLDLSDTSTLETVQSLLNNDILLVADDVKAGIESAIDNALKNDSYTIPDNIQDSIEQSVRDSEVTLDGAQIAEIEQAALPDNDTGVMDDIGGGDTEISQPEQIEAPNSDISQDDNNGDYADNPVSRSDSHDSTDKGTDKGSEYQPRDDMEAGESAIAALL